jgi:tRNA(fMet)-specific endonuclease VapC
MFILDTDHISLFQRNHPHVSTNVLATPPLELATTVVTVEEQLRGRLERVRRARNDEEVVRAYQNLLATVLYVHTITIIGFDTQTQVIFQSLRAQQVRIGTQDLRIAAIALRQDAILVTRNRRDFVAIPSLRTEGWSLPEPEAL